MRLTLRKATGWGAVIGMGIFLAIGGALSFISIIEKLPHPANIIAGIAYAGALCGGAVGYLVWCAGNPPKSFRARRQGL